jgi:DNA (cytosine-5)-methyltransferase 1
MRIGSLCTGYGGLDLAVENTLGGRMVWCSEFEKHPSTLIEQRFPGVPNHGDLTAIDWGSLEPVDVLTGGYPCQPFSVAGLRQGENDDRHLWPHIREAIRVLRPGITILENVAGHRSKGFASVLRDCAEDGLTVRWVSVRASDAGAPHRRERLFFAITDSSVEGLQREVIRRGRHEPVRERGIEDWGGSATAGTGRTDIVLMPTVVAMDYTSTPETFDAFASRHKAKHGNGNGHGNLLAVEVQRLMPTPRARDGNGGDCNPQGGPSLPQAAVDLLPTPNASDATGGGAHPDKRQGHSQQLIDYALLAGSERWGKYAAAIERWEQLTRPAPPPTELGRKGNPRLSVDFSEWMMGLPAGWVTGVDIPRNAQLKLLGNGVVPQQAQIALHHLLDIEWEDSEVLQSHSGFGD